MKDSVNNNKKTKHRSMFVKEIAHFLFFRKPLALLFDKKEEYKMQEMSSPPEQRLFSSFYSIKFTIDVLSGP